MKCLVTPFDLEKTGSRSIKHNFDQYLFFSEICGELNGMNGMFLSPNYPKVSSKMRCNDTERFGGVRSRSINRGCDKIFLTNFSYTSMF